MKNKFKSLFVMIAFVLLVVVMAGGTTVKAASAVADGSYYFSSCMVTKFQVKNNKLTLKISKKDDTGIENGDGSYKKYKLEVKVAKDCKYLWEDFVRGTGESSSGKTTYAEMKKAIKGDRDFYVQTSSFSNVGMSRVEVKNGKAVKIVYFHM